MIYWFNRKIENLILIKIFKLLAGSNINDLTNNKKSALHLVAECSHENAASIANILIENGIDFNALDSTSNNGKFKDKFFLFLKAFLIKYFQALHVSVQHGNLPVIKILLENSDIDVYTLNSKYKFKLSLLFKIYLFIFN